MIFFFAVMFVFNMAANFVHPVTPTIIVDLNLNDYMLGLALAAASLAAVKGRELYDVAGILLVYLSAHFVFCASSSTAASISVTKRKVLDMLQVKE